MNELLVCMENVDFTVRKSRIAMEQSFLEYEQKMSSIEEYDPQYFQEGVADKLADAGVPYRKVRSLLFIISGGLTRSVGDLIIRTAGECSPLISALVDVISIGGAIASSALANKYREKVVSKELITHIDDMMSVLLERIKDDDKIEYEVNLKMKKFRNIVRVIIDDLSFSIKKNTIDTSLHDAYRDYRNACEVFYKYSSNEKLINIIRSPKTGKRSVGGKGKSKEQNQTQFPDFIKATKKFLDELHGVAESMKNDDDKE